LERETSGLRSEVANRSEEASDESLVARVACGDRAAYAKLVLRHTDRFLALAERLLGERGEAEDVLQDAFSRLWTRADRFDPETARFTTWFYRVVANACTDRLRRRGRSQPLPENWDGVDTDPPADEKLDQSQRAGQVRRALDCLPERQKVAVTLCYFEGLTNVEAADVLSISVKALESLLVRARRGLKAELGEGI